MREEVSLTPLPAGVPTDPSEIGALDTSLTPVSLEELTDHDLVRVERTLVLVCGRNKAVFKEKYRGYACVMLRLARRERNRRGLLIL